MVVGNINHQTLEEIWQSDLMRDFRKWHLDGVYQGIPVCEKCNTWAAYTNIWRWIDSAGGGGIMCIMHQNYWNLCKKVREVEVVNV